VKVDPLLLKKHLHCTLEQESLRFTASHSKTNFEAVLACRETRSVGILCVNRSSPPEVKVAAMPSALMRGCIALPILLLVVAIPGAEYRSLSRQDHSVGARRQLRRPEDTANVWANTGAVMWKRLRRSLFDWFSARAIVSRRT